MARAINTGTLTKQFVLNRVSQVSIFSTYLNVSSAVVQHCIQTGEFICSPLRVDDHPTCGFKYDSNNKLKMKDFAGYFWGDCFDLVAFVMTSMYRIPIDISKKTDFIKVLRHITLAFKDVFYGKAKDINMVNEISSALDHIRTQKPIIEFAVREWTDRDIKYWDRFGITIHDLNLNFIYPVQQYYINRNINPEPKYFYSPNDPCYAYMLGQDRTGIKHIKFYFPFRNADGTRFITNCNHLEGIYNLDDDNYDIICITKSTKDRVALIADLKRCLLLYGEDFTMKIGVINIPHETYRLRPNEYGWLYSKLNKTGYIVSLMDNDRPGKLQSIWLLNNFDIEPLLIPKNTYSKDYSEYRHRFGEKHSVNLIFETANKIIHGTRRNRNKGRINNGGMQEDGSLPF